jgi:hypothetical protein
MSMPGMGAMLGDRCVGCSAGEMNGRCCGVPRVAPVAGAVGEGPAVTWNDMSVSSSQLSFFLLTGSSAFFFSSCVFAHNG